MSVLTAFPVVVADGLLADEAQARVACGSVWLDDVRPGWHNNVDLDVLDLDDQRRCVLTQLFGAWFKTPDLRVADAIDMGFLTDTCGRFLCSGLRADLPALARAWRAAICQRRVIA